VRINPVFGVVLLVVCIVATFIFGKYHIDAGNVISTVLAVGVAILMGINHQQTQGELTALRASIRPPSLTNEAGFQGTESDTARLGKMLKEKDS
jgi:xanthine/uracil/vitamin C permease (AzgA family)